MDKSEGKPSLLQQYREAKTRGDEQAAAEVLRDATPPGSVGPRCADGFDGPHWRRRAVW